MVRSVQHFLEVGAVELTAADLETTRPVLEGSVSLKEVAINYSGRRKTIVAAAILAGAEVPDSDLHDGSRSLYGFLLEQLVREPGVPEGGWGKGPWPSWYDSSSSFSLVDRSRRYGFHTGGYRGASGVMFVGNPQLTELVNEKPEYATFCKAAYQSARAALLKRRAERGR
ncbi:MAG TPA: hypothetical protein VFH06_03015 [Candidatus Saccharimonadales bacterium]|nr:hypothetical protein [Candidatus Saccharimonadales bacterium]